MPVFREDVDFFFDKFIKVSSGGDRIATVWAVGSHKGNLIMTVIEKTIDDLTLHDIADKPAFVTLHDLMKFSPYWEYDTKALDRAEKLAQLKKKL
ncbi:hypothetical protein [Microcoleus sp. herbarium2]|uniref:hypothetical protein n=1 Tax=Microcoleus sp. herbarium2 TaxID=3055433 RepID=UPI002FD05101